MLALLAISQRQLFFFDANLFFLFPGIPGRCVCYN
jgi:hypothetical protein